MSRLIRCVRSGPKSPVGHCARNGVAVDAGGAFKYAFPFGCAFRSVRRLTLLLHPAVELIARLHIDAQQHLGVLRAAILGALPQVQSSLVRIDPHAVFAVWNQVRFPGQTRHPEAVIGVGGKQLDESRAGCAGSLTGTCSSFAVTMFRPDSETPTRTDDRWRPLQLHWRVEPLFWTLAMTRAVAMNKATTIRIGMTVHASST